MRRGKRSLLAGSLLITLFAIWTVLIQTVDVKPAGETGTVVGFAALNCGFHEFTGVHMAVYHITDWLGLIPVFVCLLFGFVGLMQLVRRRGLLKVDFDILLLGVYYMIVILSYLVFEMIPINYRPVLIGGFQEASYPSSTTLLVLSVMPTLVFHSDRRLRNTRAKRAVCVLTSFFSIFMVIGRLVSGVHWLTDIVGSVLLSRGLFYIYRGIVLLYREENPKWEA